MRHSTLFFDASGNPTRPLLNLLSLCEVEHVGTLPSIRDATQREWYQAGKLRAEIAEKHGSKKEQVLPLFEQLGLVSEVRSNRLEHSFCLLLGATVVAVRKRLAFLLSEWERGVRFVHLAFLGSNRPLMQDKERSEIGRAHV